MTDLVRQAYTEKSANTSSRDLNNFRISAKSTKAGRRPTSSLVFSPEVLRNGDAIIRHQDLQIREGLMGRDVI